jgi:cysteine synthase A
MIDLKIVLDAASQAKHAPHNTNGKLASMDIPARRFDALIGNTPIVKLFKVVSPDMAEVWIKLEGQNPAGSIKDRTATGLIDDAEARGLLTRGSGQTIIEPTSGNTGIGLAFLAAVRGYRCVIVLPDTMSEERKRTLLAYGATLEFTPGHLRMQGAIPRAQELAEEHGWFMPNQFENPANPRYHQRVTGPEIWQQMQGRIDAFVWGSGTGGSISGIGRYLKSQRKEIKVYAVEPARSAVINGHDRGAHKFQGMGPGFLPKNLDLDMLDGALMVYEEDAFPLARRLAQEEGIFIGMSSGATAVAALQVARELGPGKVVLCLAADTAARYMSTELFADS